jgi:DNA modification methylase
MKGAGVGDYLAPGAVHIGSVLDLAGRLEPQSVQTIVSSPPYLWLRDYGVPPSDWPAVTYVPLAGVGALTVPAMTCCLGLEPTIEAFIGHLLAIFRALRPALKDDGTCWVNMGDSYATHGGGRAYGSTDGGVGRADAPGAHRYAPKTMPPKSLLMVPHRLALALQANGWVIRMDCVWKKSSPMPESVTDRPTKSHEYMFLIAKSPQYFYDAEAIKEPVTGGTPAKGAKGAPPKALSKAAHHADSSAKVKNNRSFIEATWGLVESRNKRSVWEVASAAFPDAHYATFPPDLIRPCILAGTSERGECAACGRAWVRVVERGEPQRIGGNAGVSVGHAVGPMDRGGHGQWDEGHMPLVRPVTTTGWAPQCSCPPGTPTRPQVVLDPFSGSGTTGQVAAEEGRDYIGFDLDERALGWYAARRAKIPVGRLFA